MPIIDVIKYEGGNNILVWKHPREDYNTDAQLIVHETQEAIVFKNGLASDLYTGGAYTLQSENLPGIRKAIALFTGGVSPNHCEVYFINKIVSMNVLWGTTTPLIIQDPLYQVPLKVRAHGQFAVRVGDSRKLLLKLIGNIDVFSQSTLSDYFRGLLMSRIKELISQMMVQGQYSFLEINSYLSVISENIKNVIVRSFEDYGIIVENFFIEGINVEEDSAYLKIRDAQAKNAERKLQDYTYVTERSFNVAEKQAANEGTSGTIAGAGIGMGVGIGAGQVIGGMMNQALVPVAGGFAQNMYPQTGAYNGTPKEDFGVLNPKPLNRQEPEMQNVNTGITSKKSFEDRLAMLELLKGKISDEDYQRKLNELLNEI